MCRQRPHCDAAAKGYAGVDPVGGLQDLCSNLTVYQVPLQEGATFPCRSGRTQVDSQARGSSGARRLICCSTVWSMTMRDGGRRGGMVQRGVFCGMSCCWQRMQAWTECVGRLRTPRKCCWLCGLVEDSGETEGAVEGEKRLHADR